MPETSSASFLQALIARLQELLGLSPAPSPTGPPAAGSIAPVSPRLSLIILDPVIPQEGGQRLSQLLGWNDSDRLAADCIADLKFASSGYANYRVVERIVVDDFPPLADGFVYTPEEFMRCWRLRSGFHQPYDVDYHNLVARHNLIQKINANQIDEVWTIGFPYAGFYESRMAGPGAFWCNAPPLENTSQAQRKFIIMAYNFERGVGEMLESYGHRSESIMSHVYRKIPEERSLWKRFIRHEKTHPGLAEVGTVHYAPNSLTDYDWGNSTPVVCRSRAWQNFPDLSSSPVTVNCAEWGHGDIRQHHLWWFRNMPHIAGQADGISNNWWEYIVDPNRV